MRRQPWEFLPRSTFTKGGINCTAEDFAEDYMPIWYFAIKQQFGFTIKEHVLTHKCHKYIQSIFGGSLKEIMAIMAYSLSNTGFRYIHREDVSVIL